MEETAVFDPASWSAHLTTELGRPTVVRFGRARRDVLVAKEFGGILHVRMNYLFGEAPAEVRSAVAAWLRSGKRARSAAVVLDDWVDQLGKRLAHEPRRRTRLRTQGAHHDLEEIGQSLLAQELAHELAPEAVPPLTWGRRGKARRSLQLGSYDSGAHLIRIHPVLDQEHVPRFFVRYVLFHEFLHVVYPHEVKGNGRVLHHGPEFKKHEQGYGEFELALAWQERNVRALIRSARTGVPLAYDRGPRRTLATLVQGLLFPLR